MSKFSRSCHCSSYISRYMLVSMFGLGWPKNNWFRHFYWKNWIFCQNGKSTYGKCTYLMLIQCSWLVEIYAWHGYFGWVCINEACQFQLQCLITNFNILFEIQSVTCVVHASHTWISQSEQKTPKFIIFLIFYEEPAPRPSILEFVVLVLIMLSLWCSLYGHMPHNWKWINSLSSMTHPPP